MRMEDYIFLATLNSCLGYPNVINILQPLMGQLIFELGQVFLALYFHFLKNVLKITKHTKK